MPLTIYTLEIRSNSHRGLSVPDACQVPVSSTKDVIELMNLGQRNRAVGATALNDRSSRSHRYILFIVLSSTLVYIRFFLMKQLSIGFLNYQFCIFLTVHVQGRDLTSGTILRGCMHLVDLAGSERVDKSEATGDRLKEAQHINKSLP